MTTMPSTDLLLDLFASGLVVAAAVTDVSSRVIPNRLTLPVIVAAPLVQLALLGPGALGHSLLGAIAVSLVPLLGFARGGIGGGDVKLLAAIGALLGAPRGLWIELFAMLLAAVYASFVLASRGQLLRTLLRSLHLLGGALPPDAMLAPDASLRLGPAIAAATLGALWLGALVP